MIMTLRTKQTLRNKYFTPSSAFQTMNNITDVTSVTRSRHMQAIYKCDSLSDSETVTEYLGWIHIF